MAFKALMQASQREGSDADSSYITKQRIV